MFVFAYFLFKLWSVVKCDRPGEGSPEKGLLSVTVTFRQPERKSLSGELSKELLGRRMR